MLAKRKQLKEIAALIERKIEKNENWIKSIKTECEKNGIVDTFSREVVIRQTAKNDALEDVLEALRGNLSLLRIGLD